MTRKEYAMSMRGLLAASMAALALVTAGPAHAEEPPPPPWPTGCQSPLVIGSHAAIRKWCGEPLFGFGPAGQLRPGEIPPPQGATAE